MLSAKELKERNDKIVKCITDLKSQRNDLNFLIEKQQQEKLKLQAEIECITYKLSLIGKSLAQRITTRANYDRTIKQSEESYNRIVESSEILLQSVQRQIEQLEQMMDKKVGTETPRESETYFDKISIVTEEFELKTDRYDSSQHSTPNEYMDN